MLDAPDDWSIPELGPDVDIHHDLRRTTDTALAFVRSLSGLLSMAISKSPAVANEVPTPLVSKGAVCGPL